jgi:hypothetical protein
MISAEEVINVSTEQARDWFFSLEDHPERYRFDTHNGIEFVQGNFGKVGARFKSREKLSVLKTELLFEVTEVGETWFRLKLINPSWVDAWATFSIQELSPDSVSLQIEIGSDTQRGQSWLKFPPVKNAIRKQITSEVDHIKESMESAVWGDGNGI